VPERKFLKPNPEGRQVPEAVGYRMVPQEGKEYPLTSYYIRRLVEGSLVEAESPKPKPKAVAREEKKAVEK
jgi:hypothetical protein